MSRAIAIGTMYLVLMTALVFGVANTTGGESYDWIVWVLLAAQPIMGLLVGRWWAVPLPLIIVAISIPAGNPPITPSNAEPLPIWFGLAVGAAFAVPLVAAGVVTRKVFDWRKSSRFAT